MQPEESAVKQPYLRKMEKDGIDNNRASVYLSPEQLSLGGPKWLLHVQLSTLSEQLFF